ncbi:PAS domain S-box protein [Chamaesiphon sp. VAR_48_metabat_135_sub]|uniref:PAS domain S-box protein n=1 Tax=Chamaesiphon sp. VAR_48_metabat_135_sub TaxID=2964699 RepID=UPI00286C03F7|nr:PAS domain S-box protein [Chamaesiphon sp. VAR_48_metabat_135_sub]
MTNPTYTVLIVDDLQTHRELFGHFLLTDSSCDYRILEAESVRAGIELHRISTGEAAPTSKIDAILLDYSLPDGDGLDFLTKLHAQSNGNSPPVVMVTGRGDENIAAQAIKLGAQDYIATFDLTPARLQSAVASAIENARLRLQVQQSNDLLRVSLDMMLDRFGIYSAIRDTAGQIIDFRFEYLNAAALESNQMTAADMDRGLCEMFPAQCETGLFEKYCQVVTTGVPLILDDSIYTDVFGTQLLTRSYDTRISKLNDGFVAAWRDVTVQKQAEHERDRFFDLSIDLLATGNFAGYFTRLNPAFERVLGFTSAELMAQPFSYFVHPDDLEHTISAANGLSLGTMAVDFENRYRCQDGSYRWLSWTATPSIESKSWYAVARDITDSKRVEAELEQIAAALRASEWKFSAIFNQTFERIGLLSLNGIVLEINRSALDSFAHLGYAQYSEIIGKEFWETPWWKHSPQLQAQLKTAIFEAANGQFINYQFQFPAPSGGQIVLDFSLKPVFNEIGRVVTIVAEGHDITDLKQIQAALEQRNQDLDSFVHIVSHDLKAPLRAIANLSQWIEEDLEGEILTEIQPQLVLLRSRVARMSATIDGLLDYARIGRSNDKIEPVCVAQLLAETIDSLAPPPTFSISIAPNLPTLNTKRLFLSQVFANLIGNVIKHHDRSDGSIQISCQECGGFYEFEIADDGPGIAPENHDKVFAIFQAVNPQNSPDSTGIGLAIVKKIIETEGGTIRLESELGHGTTFYFTWKR